MMMARRRRVARARANNAGSCAARAQRPRVHGAAGLLLGRASSLVDGSRRSARRAACGSTMCGGGRGGGGFRLLLLLLPLPLLCPRGRSARRRDTFRNERDRPVVQGLPADWVRVWSASCVRAHAHGQAVEGRERERGVFRLHERVASVCVCVDCPPPLMRACACGCGSVVSRSSGGACLRCCYGERDEQRAVDDIGRYPAAATSACLRTRAAPLKDLWRRQCLVASHTHNTSNPRPRDLDPLDPRQPVHSASPRPIQRTALASSSLGLYLFSCSSSSFPRPKASAPGTVCGLLRPRATNHRL